MENLHEIRVLRAFHPYLRALQAYNARNYRNKSVSVKIRQIIETLGVTVGITSALLLVGLATWHMIENVDISALSISGARVLCFSQMVFAVVIFMIKTPQINETVSSVQRTIDKRELSWAHWDAYFSTFFWYFFPWKSVECKYSTGSFAIYKRIEQIHTMLTRVLFNANAALIVTMYGSMLIFPISYTLVQHPEPSHWRLAFEIQWESLRCLPKLLPQTAWLYSIRFHSSHLIDRNVYVEYLVDWAIEMFATMCTSFSFVAVASLYVGLCFYIGGMVADMRAKMAEFDQNRPLAAAHIRSIYVTRSDQTAQRYRWVRAIVIHVNALSALSDNFCPVYDNFFFSFSGLRQRSTA